jgi:hypothetical protein
MILIVDDIANLRKNDARGGRENWELGNFEIARLEYWKFGIRTFNKRPKILKPPESGFNIVDYKVMTDRLFYGVSTVTIESALKLLSVRGY